MLEHVATSMRRIFRNTDILGRIGGDEFCIYIKDIPSVDFVYKKCQRLSNLVKNIVEHGDFSVSIGIALVYEKEPYDAIFQKADIALYQAKSMGKAQIIIYQP